MISSFSAVAADDVSIRCSIRRSENAANQSFDESMPYTCTMRNWKPVEPGHGQSGTSQMMGRDTVKDGCHGPELLLCPVDMTRSNSVPNQYPGDSHSPPNARFQSLYDSRLRERRNTSDGSIGTTTAQHDENSSETSGSGKHGHKRIRSLIPPSNRTSAAANAAFGRLESGTSTRTFSIVNSDPGQNSTHSPRCQSPPPTSYVIPLSDILVVDANNRNKYSSPFANNGNTEVLSSMSSFMMTITTISHGFFEFCFESRNAQIVFQAFLQASLPQERLSSTISARKLMGKGENEPQHDASGKKLEEEYDDGYNMDNFTAKELSERVRTESQYDKMKRRMSRFSWKVKEIAGNFVDGEFCACTCIPSNDKKEGAFHFSNLDLLAPSRTDTSASETEEDKFYMDEPATPNAANRGISYRISYEETPMKSASYMTDVTDTTPISEYNEGLHLDLMMPSSLETPIMTPNRELNTRLFDAEPMPTFQTPPPKQMSLDS